MYLIHYITTDCEGCDAMDDDFTSAASDPIEAIQELKKHMVYKQHILSIEYIIRIHSHMEGVDHVQTSDFRKH